MRTFSASCSSEMVTRFTSVFGADEGYDGAGADAYETNGVGGAPSACETKPWAKPQATDTTRLPLGVDGAVAEAAVAAVAHEGCDASAAAARVAAASGAPPCSAASGTTLAATSRFLSGDLAATRAARCSASARILACISAAAVSARA